jgi:hypothetical protein
MKWALDEVGPGCTGLDEVGLDEVDLDEVGPHPSFAYHVLYVE